MSRVGLLLPCLLLSIPPVAAEPDASAGRRLAAAQLARIELALDVMGYRIDPPDGLLDARTETALAALLERQGLPESTPVSQALVAMVEAAAELQRAERAIRTLLRRASEERLLRADLLARRAPTDFVAADNTP
jgi:hypothetical protein